jgi:cysteine-rich repeat protein
MENLRGFFPQSQNLAGHLKAIISHDPLRHRLQTWELFLDFIHGFIFSDITADQTIWCKEWLELESNHTLNSLRLWLYLIDGQFVVLWNPSDALTHLRNWELDDAFNYQYQKLGVYAKFGWTYLAVNFKTNVASNKLSVWAYMANHDQCKTVSNTFTFDGPLVDDDKFIFWLGGTANPDNTTLKYVLTKPLMAVVNQVYFVKGEILERWHAMDAFGFQWHDTCQICRAIDQPKCLEDFETHVMHYWDFGPFRWYRPVWDYGDRFSTIGLGIPMDGQGLFVKDNGMWFDGGRTLVPAPIIWAVFSFSIDVWFKFYDTVGGTLIDTTNGDPRFWGLGFTGPNTVTFRLNDVQHSTTFNFNAPADYNKWMIAQASVARQGLDLSNIWIKMNEEPISCSQQISFYNDINGTRLINMRIGNGFGGYIRKIMIYDYPKTEPSMEMMYKEAPQCYKFHHSQPDCDYCDVHYNFTCYTSCSEYFEWDYDCKSCDGKWYSCSGNDAFHCFSWDRPLYIFHERCTCCPEVWGDGIFMMDSQYEWDDGNNNVDDGCDSECLLEAGFTWTHAFMGRSVCTEIWGDGRHINHACDDANTNNGDGWNSNWAIETGYQWTGGDRNTVDVWWEIWGDGRDLGNYPWDDGNVVTADGWDASWVIELGWQWVGGAFATPDTCTEIWGDGWRTYDPWDDKNTDIGDGCSATCTVEFGWQCGSEIPSICWKISQPSIIEVTHVRGLISITFNETVYLENTFTQSDINISISGPLSPYSGSIELVNSTTLITPSPNLTIWFTYSSSNQFIGNGSETLTISLPTDKILNSAYNFAALNSSISFTLYPQESTETCGELMFLVPIILMMIAIFVIGVLSSIGGHSMWIAWQALSIVQFVNFVPFTMIYSPSWLVIFGRGFDVFNGRLFIILDWITRYTITRHDFYNEINHKFVRGGYPSSAIIFNATDLLLIWIIVLVIIPIMYGFRRLFFNKNHGFKLQLDKFRNTIIFILILYSYMRLAFLSMLNLKHARFDDYLSWISTWVAIVVALLVAGYPLYETWNVKQFHTELITGRKPTHFRLYVLYSDFRVNHPLQYAYYWQYFLRRFLFIAMIIAWPQDEYLTLWLSTVMHICALMYVAFILPFTSKTRNIAVMVSELGMVVINGMLFPLLRGDVEIGLKHYQKHAFRFFLVVWIVIAALLFFILFDSFAHVKKVLQACRKEPEDDGPNKMLDSFSSDSLTEREISLESDDSKKKYKIELYDPKTNKEKYELEKKKKEEKKAKGKDKKRPPTPPSKGDALISQFGRPLFKDTQEVDDIKDNTEQHYDESDSDSDSESSDNSEKQEEVKIKETPQRSMFNPEALKEDPMTLTNASLQARETTDFKGKIKPKEESKGVLFYERGETPSNSSESNSP